jgi:NFU1 iron-sulfur cluster scaffold homolog, mitochondrial
MPKIAEIEPTPNPNARKFILKEPLSFGVSRSFASPAEAHDDPLARALFEIPSVTNVFYVDHWITVTQDGNANWDELLREAAKPIREAPAASAQSAQYADDGARNAALDDDNLSDAERLKLAQIIDLLDERVRPFLQGDGGDLHVVGLADNVLKVHYQGACGSCPSSLSATLAGIEGMVRQIDPELSVEAV